MNAYRFNQIAMAVLGALLLFFGARTIINIAFEEHEEKPGYDVPGTEEKPGEQKPAGDDLACAAREGRCRARRGSREEMRALPQLR